MLSLNFALMETERFHIVFQNDTITTPTTPPPKKKPKKSFLQPASLIGLILRLCKLKHAALIEKIQFW